MFVGISVVVQLTFWTGEAGQSQMLGPLLVTVVARELGPVLINLIVIVRSGSAMTTELGILKINGEVRALEARGGDPFLQLVVPRVLGTVVSTFCLTVVFILVAFASGYVFAAWTGIGNRDLLLFADTVYARSSPRTCSTFAESILPALFPARPGDRRAGRQRVGHGNPARHATGAHPLRHRIFCDLRRGLTADLLVTMNETTNIAEPSHPDDRAQPVTGRFKFRRVNEIHRHVRARRGRGADRRRRVDRPQPALVQKPRHSANRFTEAALQASDKARRIISWARSWVVSDVIVDTTGRMEAEANIRRDFFRFVRVDSSAVVKMKFGVVAIRILKSRAARASRCRRRMLPSFARNSIKAPWRPRSRKSAARPWPC